MGFRINELSLHIKCLNDLNFWAAQLVVHLHWTYRNTPTPEKTTTTTTNKTNKQTTNKQKTNKKPKTTIIAFSIFLPYASNSFCLCVALPHFTYDIKAACWQHLENHKQR